MDEENINIIFEFISRAKILPPEENHTLLYIPYVHTVPGFPREISKKPQAKTNLKFVSKLMVFIIILNFSLKIENSEMLKCENRT